MQTELNGMLKIAGVKMFAADEVAQQLGLSAKTIKRMINDGELKGRRVGKALYVSEGALKEWVERDELERSAKASKKRGKADVVEAEPVCVNGTIHDKGDEGYESEPWVYATLQKAHNGDTWLPGVVLQFMTDTFMVGEEGDLIPLSAETGRAFFDSQEEEVERATQLLMDRAEDDEGEDEEEEED